MNEASVIKSYQDLRVWKNAIKLTNAIYSITEQFPKREWYGLANQMRRASVSVASNIAEGSVRGTREFAHFLSISTGSLAELETQIIIAHMRKFITSEEYEDLYSLIMDTSRMLMALYRSIHGKVTHKARGTRHEALTA